MTESFFHVDMLFLVAILVLFAFLAALIAFLVVRERRRDANLEHFASSAEEYSLHRAQQRAQEIVSRAVEDARKLTTESEAEGIRAIERGKVSAKDLNDRYEGVLEEVETDIREHLAADTARATTTTEHMAASFDKALEVHLSKTTAGLEQAVKAHGDRLDQTFRALEEEGVRRVAEAIEHELAAARTSVKQYEQARMAAIDTHLVDLVARTAEIALGKAMPLEEHTRLLYRALEEARKEGFFHTTKERETAR
jgi:hypothetical protein